MIVDGALWSDPERAEVSIEQDFAADLGVGVGDTVTFNIQGVPLELLVSSIRTVEWERFSINFFLVVEPGVLDEAPRYRIAAARLAATAELPLQDRLAATFPNVTMLRIREVLDKIVAVLRQLGFGVRLLGAFTVLAGIAILAGAVSAGAVRRGRQVALYKTLGMTRLQVVAVFTVEYALVGLVAGVLGTGGGVVLAWLVTRFGFEIAWAWSPGVYALAVDDDDPAECGRRPRRQRPRPRRAAARRPPPGRVRAAGIRYGSTQRHEDTKTAAVFLFITTSEVPAVTRRPGTDGPRRPLERERSAGRLGPSACAATAQASPREEF